MRSTKGKLGKWDLAHLQELITIYMTDKTIYPDGDWRLLIDGSLVRYRTWPKWLAKAMDKVDKLDFRDIAREIYKTMSGNKTNDVGFASLYLDGIEAEIIELLFLLHTHARASLQSDQKSNAPIEGEIDTSDCLFQLLDGNYRISGFPIYIKHRNGDPLDIGNIVAQIKNHFSHPYR